MTKQPPSRPETGSADDAALSVQEQLDRLLAQIETEEPGTVDAEALPTGYQSPHAQAKPAFKPAAQPDLSMFAGQASSDDLSEAMQSFEQALDTDRPMASVDTSNEAPKAAGPAPTPAENLGETDMLAALNAALKDLSPGGANKPAPSPKPAPAEPALLDEEALQAEINALLNAPLNAPPRGPSQEQPFAEQASASQQAQSSTEDQIAEEIESLLHAEAQSTAEAGVSDQAQDSTSIDELDEILAGEIDEDEELAGDFQSVDSLTAGIDTGRSKAKIDEHAATAHDVAAELDNQPEDFASEPSPDMDIDLDEIAGRKQRIASVRQDEPVQAHSSWRDRLGLVQEKLLQLCFVINWPARRFLSMENRANLGYIALLNLFGAVAVWLYLIVF